MENPTPRTLLERNPVTRQRHRSEVFWQITIPFLVITGFVLLILFLSFWPDDSQVISQEADVALIWLLVSIIFASFIILTLLTIIAYAVIRMIGIIPPYFKDGQDFFINVQGFVFHLNDRLVEPVLSLHQFGASVNAMISKLLGK
ncbi:MAG: hypothetical protein A2Z16_07525 [Chloroflexi bacterium RBG_16_54_18]|nr:MAG: hypothetical protein A2Z16_07525 [Chloroflexi bacterium RBG_16_54_18]